MLMPHDNWIDTKRKAHNRMQTIQRNDDGLTLLAWNWTSMSHEYSLAEATKGVATAERKTVMTESFMVKVLETNVFVCW
jgi:hypothetical protein